MARRRSNSRSKPSRHRSSRKRASGRIGLHHIVMIVLMGAIVLMLALQVARRDEPIALTAAALPSQSQETVQFSLCGSGGRIDCVVDGDTFWIGGEKIRIADIDTPELSPSRCAEEERLGLAAKARLQELLNAGPFALDRDGTDRYGRTLAIVRRDGASLGETLVGEGLARRYAGGRRTGWCG